MSYTLTAANCPAPQLSPPPLKRAEVMSVPGGLTTLGPSFYPGQVPANEFNVAVAYGVNATRAAGSQIYNIVNGLSLTASGLTATIAQGTAYIGEQVDVPSSGLTGITLSPSTRNWIWLYLSGTPQVQPGTLAAPNAAPAVCLGFVDTNSTGPTAIGMDGRIKNGGFPSRTTADAGAPTDTPPAGCPPLITFTATAIYLWSDDYQKHFKIGDLASAHGRPVVSLSANGSVPAMDRILVLMDCTSGNVKGALPSAASCWTPAANGMPARGLEFEFLRVDATNNSMIAATMSGDSMLYQGGASPDGTATAQSGVMSMIVQCVGPTSFRVPSESPVLSPGS